MTQTLHRFVSEQRNTDQCFVNSDNDDGVDNNTRCGERSLCGAELVQPRSEREQSDEERLSVVAGTDVRRLLIVGVWNGGRRRQQCVVGVIGR